MEAKNLKCPEGPTVEFMEQVRMRLLDWMVDDAYTAEANSAFVGALILGVCALDVLAGLYRGVVREVKNESFRLFITRYLPHHDEYLNHNVWKHMRNSLIHAYSTKGFKYTNEYPDRHLQKDEDGLLWIHVKSFVAEVDKAAKDYINDLPNDPALWENFKKKWARDPLLGPITDSGSEPPRTDWKRTEGL